ncbi:hypothetical protein K7432_016391 [Basidiobolus ranarum]|uniref:Transcription factor 25 n=1 Tax=Basidiobolus ranarum TaxID=34480 RepID=A0ABR2WES7_9FUNG
MREKELNATLEVAEISSEEEEQTTTKPVMNAFAMLGGDDIIDSEEEDEMEDEEEKVKVEIEKENKVFPTRNSFCRNTRFYLCVIIPSLVSFNIESQFFLSQIKAPSPNPNGSKKKNKKKNKSKEATLPVTESKKPNKKKKKKGKLQPSELSLEEFEQALNEISNQLNETTPIQVDPNASTSTQKIQSRAQKTLLTVDPRALDADGEMKRIFGSKIVNEELKKRRQTRNFKKTILAVPTDTWPRLDKLGLSMELLENNQNTLHFKFTHNLLYQTIQYKFLDCVISHDPNNIARLSQMYPYHADTLIQLSEIAKHSGDIAMAAELIERALYGFERSFHSQFNLTTGACRLDYNLGENRSFFLAICRHLQFLARRGCWRTAFEFDKLLLSLSPDDDPLGALLSLDFYALKSQEYEYLLQFYNEWDSDLSKYPSFLYSCAMAKYKLESKSNEKGHQESLALLSKAILRFPAALVILFEKCGTHLDSEITNNPFFREDCKFVSQSSGTPLKILIDLFAERNFSLWKEPEVITWVKEAIPLALSQSNSTSSQDLLEGSRIRVQLTEAKNIENISRHVIISDFQNLMADLPKEVKSAVMYAHDPLPPRDGENLYNKHPSYGGSSSSYDGDWESNGGILENLLGRFGWSRGAENNPEEVHTTDDEEFEQELNQLRAQDGSSDLIGSLWSVIDRLLHQQQNQEGNEQGPPANLDEEDNSEVDIPQEDLDEPDTQNHQE